MVCGLRKEVPDMFGHVKELMKTDVREGTAHLSNI